MRDGPEAGLTHIDAVLEHGELANYYLAHSARADMYRRLGRTDEAGSSYEVTILGRGARYRFVNCSPRQYRGEHFVKYEILPGCIIY